MTDADPRDARPRPAADPTMRVARPPVPGRAIRADLAAGYLTTPPVREDDPTVDLAAGVRRPPQRTLEFGNPAPVRVSVGPRPRPRRRFRTWPWIAAVVVALLVLGVVLLVLMTRGASFADAELLGRAAAVVPLRPPAG